MNRVVVTGIGVVSSLGLNTKEWWKNILKGRSTINFSDKFKEIDIKPQPILAEIANFNFKNQFPHLSQYEKYLDRGMKFGLVAADEAFKDSLGKNTYITEKNNDFGVYVGTTTGGICSAYTSAREYINSGEVLDDKIIYKFPPSSWPALIAHHVKAQGKLQVVGTSCYAGGESVGAAFREIKSGRLKVALAGGLDAPIVTTNYLSFKNIGAAISYEGEKPAEACRPFSKERGGMVFGEGSAFCVLESLEHALARNAKIYAEVLGYSVSSDGENMVHPSKTGSRWSDAIDSALNEAGISSNKIDFVSCHGTGTILNDEAEMRAIKNSISNNIRIGSIKSMLGHSFGGACAIEILQLIKTLETGWIPPTINFTNFRTGEGKGCIVNNRKEYHKCKYVLKTATGFGGSNLAMVLKGWDCDE